MVIAIVFSFASCKGEKETPRKPVSNVSSAMTYSEYMAQAEKEKQEKKDRLMNADWKKHPEDFKLIALTFDDAPSYNSISDNNTVTIIDAINKYEGAGTLFVQGTAIEAHGTALLYYALENGFELGNHTYSHPFLTKLSKQEIINEITSLNKSVEEKFGVTMKYIRPGYLDIDERGFEVSKELRMPIIHCSKTISTKDYDSLSTEESVKSTILNNAYDGAIVLCHGWSNPTAACIEDVCKSLYERGYRFVTLSELFEYKGIKNVPLGEIIYDANF